jgi:hypothetical protein
LSKKWLQSKKIRMLSVSSLRKHRCGFFRVSSNSSDEVDHLCESAVTYTRPQRVMAAVSRRVASVACRRSCGSCATRALSTTATPANPREPVRMCAVLRWGRSIARHFFAAPTRGRAVYLDAQATTPLDPRVLDAMMPFYTNRFGNPHSRTHAYGWEAEAVVEKARKQGA